ncbi:MAG: hypothetical protein NT154_39480 [Verrucomicrobia bacterium]|nr:hypothetical protein [Verrucomicrobiota bacterium]
MLFWLPANAGKLPDLHQARTSEDLAKFIYQMTTNKVRAGDLLQGLNDPGTIQPAPYKIEIPVRGIYGTIIEERFGDKLRGLYEQGKRYSCREICSFQDSQGEIWRFHIGIYDEKQYRIMRSFLASRTPNKHLQPTPR